uniref:Uncharacterized protein n=1 Tax=Rhizophora mucronata TaxID=61149 RepID=A0A2P2PZU7_RHIMU
MTFDSVKQERSKTLYKCLKTSSKG